jgi:hypothetical protein
MGIQLLKMLHGVSGDGLLVHQLEWHIHRSKSEKKFLKARIRLLEVKIISMQSRELKIILRPGELTAAKQEWIPNEQVPILARTRYYKRNYWNFWHPIVVAIASQRWAVEYQAAYKDGVPDPQNAKVIFTFTDEPETNFELGDDPFISSAAICPIRFFKCSPVNSESIFVPKGKKLYQFATYYTGWGDGGNETLYLSLDSNGFPESVYLEASCLLRESDFLSGSLRPLDGLHQRGSRRIT